jgi:hypothetical protein
MTTRSKASFQEAGVKRPSLILEAVPVLIPLPVSLDDPRGQESDDAAEQGACDCDPVLVTEQQEPAGESRDCRNEPREEDVHPRASLQVSDSPSASQANRMAVAGTP